MLKKLDNPSQTRPDSYLVPPKQQLHKYVAICLGCGVLALASFPIAYWRVSQSGKYNGGAFNTLTPEQPQKSEFETPH